MNTATKTGLNALKPATKKIVHKAAEPTGEFIESKIANKTVKPKSVLDENLRDVKEVIISPEKTEYILNKSRQVL